jgi:pimeloyl-ACP methyl ester carboxylesterase
MQVRCVPALLAASLALQAVPGPPLESRVPVGKGRLRSLAEVERPPQSDLVIYGDHDFIPIEIASGIARALPNARLVTVKRCGHLADLESGADVRRALGDFVRRPKPARDHTRSID